ncbi:MAG: hypothetical protein V8T40_11985 [Phocaeicola vulgatus]
MAYEDYRGMTISFAILDFRWFTQILSTGSVTAGHESEEVCTKGEASSDSVSKSCHAALKAVLISDNSSIISIGIYRI